MDVADRAVLARFGVGPAGRLGGGGEAEVYALDPERVLRVHKNPGAADYVRRIGALYDDLDRAAVPYALPTVLDVDEDDQGSWSIERRLPGRSMDGLVTVVGGAARERMLRSYVDGAAAFGALGRPRGWQGACGELFTDAALRADTWGDLLAARLRLQLEEGRTFLIEAGIDVDLVSERILAEATLETAAAPTIVHGDYFPGNVLIGDDHEVSAVIDLGWLTVVGDPTHDVRTAVAFIDVRPWRRPGDAEVLLDAATTHLGGEAEAMIARTRRYEQARFAFVADDEHLHRWCLDGLRTLAAEIAAP
ncbi:MAG: aminoglycoside phosphotransferase family protein [Acidimicrobiales bacterium]